MSRANLSRAVHGILLLDKPVGISSNAALQRARYTFSAHKAGHTGNLDMLASGLLPLCFGEATKVSPYLLTADKRYQSRFGLGVRTATGDAEGEVIERRPVPVLTRTEIETVLHRFVGEIEQIPPMHSALKHKGRRLYQLAAQGMTVDRRPRRLRIHSIKLLAVSENDLEVEVHCSKGTYIRTLAEDIGTALGTCAYVQALRRVAVGPFLLEQALTLAALEQAHAREQTLDSLLLSLDAALVHLPAAVFAEVPAHYLLQGQAVRPASRTEAGLCRLYDSTERFLGVGETLADGRVTPRRLIRS